VFVTYTLDIAVKEIAGWVNALRVTLDRDAACRLRTLKEGCSEPDLSSFCRTT